MRGLPLPKPFARFVPLAAVGLTAVVGGALLSPCPASAAMGARPRRDGDILRIFERQTVYIITNDDPALADALLENAGQKERHILTIEEWRNKPASLRQVVSSVFLINRERLPDGLQIPAACSADGDEIWTEVRHTGRSGGPNYEVTLSAPDSVWLHRAALSFRSLSDVPRKPIQRNVRSIVVVPVGSGAGEAAALFVRRQNTSDDFNKRTAAHVLPAALMEPAGKSPLRCAAMQELVLVDRSSAGENCPALPDGKTLTSRGERQERTEGCGSFTPRPRRGHCSRRCVAPTIRSPFRRR